jgi:hypothetical protein
MPVFLGCRAGTSVFLFVRRQFTKSDNNSDAKSSPDFFFISLADDVISLLNACCFCIFHIALCPFSARGLLRIQEFLLLIIIVCLPLIKVLLFTKMP